jgi:hypothetical protein
MPDDISHAARVRDKEQLKHAKAGPDWSCRYCRSQQRKLSGECAICGAPQDEEEYMRRMREESEIDSFFQEEKTKSKKVISKPAKKKLAKKKSKKSLKVTAKPKLAPRNWTKVRNGFLAFLAVCLVVTGGYFLFRTKIVDVSVDTVAWQHSVLVDRYRVYHDSGFDESKPHKAFNVKTHGHRHHHYKQVRDGFRTEHYTVRETCGTKTEHYTVREACGQTCSTTPRTCRSNKNGYATCTGGNRTCSTKYCSRSKTRQVTKYCNVAKTRQVPKYKDVSVTEMWYSWNVWRWGHNRTVNETGNSTETFWPADNKVRLNSGLSEGEQERTSRKASYNVVFIDEENEKYKYTPQSLTEFQQFKVGSTHRIKTNLAGSVELAKESE